MAENPLARLRRISVGYRNWEATPGGDLLLRSGWAYLVLWLNDALGSITANAFGVQPLTFRKRALVIFKSLVGLCFGHSPVFNKKCHMPECRRNLVISWRRTSELRSDIDDYLGDMSPSLKPDLSRIYIAMPGVTVPSTDNIDGVFTFERRLGQNAVWLMRALLQAAFRPWRATIADLSPERRIAVSISVQLKDWIGSHGHNLQSVFTPYEQQPWQCEVYTMFRRDFPNCRTIGYVHSSLTNFPAQFVKHAYTPDYLLTHGTADKRVLTESLGWPEHRVIMTVSLRFSKPMMLKRSTIFLPFSIAHPGDVVEACRAIRESGYFDDDFIDIRIHPMRSQIREHLRLRDQLVKMLETLPRTSQVSQISVLTIGVTNATLEALEAGYETFSLVEDAERDGFSPEVWQELSIRPISKNLFHLSIKKAGAFLAYGDGGATDIDDLVALIKSQPEKTF